MDPVPGGKLANNSIDLSANKILRSGPELLEQQKKQEAWDLEYRTREAAFDDFAEIIVSTRLSHHGKIILVRSDNFYIPLGDIKQYQPL